ncbi:hypothetical protein GCM10011399_24010 [Subtercola lobariae]|uniref:DUF3151 domain-containing protein n=1 Tax=Subtercola lobariae TaxID=1588641 RepID=A0A917B7U0_9MICO|nr:hypothetical protein GCM10011399_24010 [Subtercola lobariae]
MPPTLLNPEDGVAEAIASVLPDGVTIDEQVLTRADLEALVRRFPTSSLVWALLSDDAFEAGEILPAYAYARVGYHRGLDALRKGGWRGQGPVPWSHEPNRGVLRSLYALRRGADAIGEVDEVARLNDFLQMSDPAASEAIETAHFRAASTADTTEGL